MRNYVNEIKVSYRTPQKCKVKVTHYNQAVAFSRSLFKPSTIELYESVFMFLLNRNNEVIGHYKLSDGGTDKAVVDIKLILSIAVKTLACGIILVHNHPSGNLKPSESDIETTKDIKKAADLLDISLLDHIIVTRDGATSLNREGLL